MINNVGGWTVHSIIKPSQCSNHQTSFHQIIPESYKNSLFIVWCNWFSFELVEISDKLSPMLLNLTLRSLVDCPAAISRACTFARVSPSIVKAIKNDLPQYTEREKNDGAAAR